MSKSKWREKSLDQIRAEAKPVVAAPRTEAEETKHLEAIAANPNRTDEEDAELGPIDPPRQPARVKRNIRLNHALTGSFGTGDNFTESPDDTRFSTILVDSIEKDATGVTLTFGRARYWVPDAGIDYIREVTP